MKLLLSRLRQRMGKEGIFPFRAPRTRSAKDRYAGPSNVQSTSARPHTWATHYEYGVIPNKPPSTPTASKTESRPGPERIQCIHWNSGGLSEELKAEWFTWLRQMPEVKLFTMVETHWGFSNSYVSEGWHITHSGKASGKGCGIMIGIRADCVDQLSIKWREIIPGRLLHWRGTIGRQQTDIVALYQTAMGFVSGDKQDALMRERQKLWKSMDDLLSGLPFRSSIIVMGDFNATLSPLAEVAGSGILQGASVAWLAKEREYLMEILKKHRLVALNTWHKPQHTYHHPNGKSQIDYILVRKQLADNRSRKCSAISSPIAAWRSSGHHPLSASLKLNWKPWQGIAKQQQRSRENAPTIEEISNADCPSLRQLQHAVQQHLDVPRQPNPRHQQRTLIRRFWRSGENSSMLANVPNTGMVIRSTRLHWNKQPRKPQKSEKTHKTEKTTASAGYSSSS